MPTALAQCGTGITFLAKSALTDDISIAALGTDVRSQSFTATGLNCVVAIVRLRVQTSGASKLVTVTLRNPAGAVVQSRNVSVSATSYNSPSNSNSVQLQGGPTGSHVCADWRLEVSRNPSDTATSVVAFANVTFRIDGGGAHTATLPLFAVVRGGTINRTMPSPVSTGNLTITATWYSDEIPFTQSFPLTFTLLRPNGTVAATGSGLAQNALFVNEINKVRINYSVTAADFINAQTWTVRVSSAVGKVKDVKITTVLLPRCG